MLSVLCDEHIDGTGSGLHYRDGAGRPQQAIEYLRVLDELYEGASDGEILEFARKESYLVLTSDSDFLAYDYSDATTGLLYVPNNRVRGSVINDILAVIYHYMDAETDFFGEVLWVNRGWLDIAL